MSARARYHFDNTYPGMRRTVGPFILYQAGDLSCEPGYEVGEHVQRVAEMTGGEVRLSPGTMYGSLSKMEKDGLIRFVREEEKRKIYAIAPLGEEVLELEMHRIERLYRNMMEARQ